MEPSERLVVRNSERGEGLVKVYVKPVDADVQVAAEHQGDDWRREDPEIKEDGGVVYGSTSSRERCHPVLTNVAPRDRHYLIDRIFY